MTDIDQLYTKLNHLKPSLKKEVSDFVDFLLSKQSNTKLTKTPKFGCAKGKFKIAPDFDEPLDDLKKYM